MIMSDRMDGDDFDHLLKSMRQEILKFDTSKYQKCSKTSDELKLKGSDALKNKKLSQALEFYNQVSVDSEERCHNNDREL